MENKKLSYDTGIKKYRLLKQNIFAPKDCGI